MLALKYMLLVSAIAMFIAALAVVACDLYAELKFRRGETRGLATYPEPEPLRWRTAVALVVLAWAPMLIALSMVVVPGREGWRARQPDHRDASRNALSTGRGWTCASDSGHSLLCFDYGRLDPSLASGQGRKYDSSAFAHGNCRGFLGSKTDSDGWHLEPAGEFQRQAVRGILSPRL